MYDLAPDPIAIHLGHVCIVWFNHVHQGKHRKSGNSGL